MDRLVIVTSFDANYYPDCTGFVASFAENYHRTTPIDFYCLVPTELMDKEQEFISAMKINIYNNLNLTSMILKTRNIYKAIVAHKIVKFW